MITLRTVMTVLATITLAACSASDIASNEENIEKQNAMREAQAKFYDLTDKSEGRTHYKYHNKFFIIGQQFETPETQALPYIFDRPNDFAKLDKVPLEDVIEKLNSAYQQHGVVVTFDDTATTYLQKGVSEKTTSKVSDDSTGVIDVLPIQKLDSMQLNTNSDSKYNYYMALNVKGASLRMVLDLIGANTGLWWRYDDGRAVFYRTTEKTFPLDSSDQAFAMTINQQHSGSESGSNSAGYTLSITSEDVKPMTEIETQLKQYVSSDGTIAVNKFDKTVTVKDTPSNLKRVEKFLHDYNFRATTAYAITTDVYEIVTEVSQDNTTSWEAVFDNAKAGFSLIAPSVVADSSAGKLGVSVVSESSSWTGSKAVANFIHKNASLYSHIHNTARTKNNIPAPMVASDNRAIVSGRSVTIDSNGFSQQSTDTKIISEGFTITNRPRLLSDGRIDLELQVNSKAIKSVKTFGDEKDMVQLEEDRINSGIGNVVVKSNEMALVTAYERELSNADITALTKDFPWWAGGGNAQKRYKASLLIFVKPVLLKR